jgi:hypothetical protein
MFTTLICIAILIAMAWLLFAVLHEDKISKQKRAVAELINADLKAELIRKFQAANDFVITRLEKILVAIKSAFGGKEPEPDYDHRLKAEILMWLVLIGIPIDAVVQWVINIRIGYFSPLVWLGISLAIALAITWFTELSAHALTADRDRPERGAHLCRLGAIITGIVSVGALALFLFGRTASAASLNEFVVSLISGSLWIIGEGLAITCGFLAAWSRHLNRSWRASKQFHRIEQRIQQHNGFKAWLEAQSSALDPKQPPAKDSLAPGSPGSSDKKSEAVASEKSDKSVIRLMPPATEMTEDRS